ncbi:MAG: hypothetical protein RIC16_10190 [Rhodospirillales bacterium]
MPDPNNRLPGFCLLVAALLTAFLSAPVSAQETSEEPESKFLRLFEEGEGAAGKAVPLGEPQSLDAPQTLEPPDTAVDGTGTDPVTGIDSGQTSDFIEVDILDALNVDSVGTLGELDGGLGPSLWNETDMPSAINLIEELPLPVASVVLGDLVQRLLLSSAEPPAGGDGYQPGDFVAIRLRTLSAIGDFDSVWRLLAVTPGHDRDLRFTRVEAETELLRGEYAKACGKATTGTRESSDAFWQRLLVMCQALAGSGPEAELGLTLLQDLGQSDATYERLVRALIDQASPTLDRLPPANPMQIAMFRTSKASLSDELVASGFADASPHVLALLADSDNVEGDTRAKMMDVLARSGTLSGRLMRRLFERSAFEPAQIDNPISSAEDIGGFSALALLYQASRTQEIDAARAEATSLAFERARNDGLYVATARAFLPIVRSIPARTDLAWFAEDAARALIMAGDTAVAIGWVSILRSAALLDTEASEALRRLTPLIHLAGLGQAPLLAEDFTRWWEIVANSPNGRADAALLLTLLEARKPGSSADLWQVMGGRAGSRGGFGADLAVWHRLAAAADTGAVGRTVLLAVHLIGGGGLIDADPLVVKHAVGALQRVGLADEAAALMLEAAVLNGL